MEAMMPFDLFGRWEHADDSATESSPSQPSVCGEERRCPETRRSNGNSPAQAEIQKFGNLSQMAALRSNVKPTSRSSFAKCKRHAPPPSRGT